MSASDAFNLGTKKDYASPAIARFLDAVKHNHAKTVTRMRRDGFNPNAHDSTGDTALHIACRYGHEQIMHLLIQAKANVNAPNHKGETPIFMAMAQANIEEMSIYIPAVINNDRPAMLEAAEVARERPNKEHRMVLALLGAGANLNARTTNNRTPLHHAMREGKTRIARDLILRGADPGIKSAAGLKPLSRKNAHDRLDGEDMLILRSLAETVRDTRKLHKIKRRIRTPGL